MEIVPLHSSPGDRARLHHKKKNVEEYGRRESEGVVSMEKCSERCNIAGFEDRERSPIIKGEV